jgi:hypothetical protein
MYVFPLRGQEDSAAEALPEEAAARDRVDGLGELVPLVIDRTGARERPAAVQPDRDALPHVRGHVVEGVCARGEEAEPTTTYCQRAVATQSMARKIEK